MTGAHVQFTLTTAVQNQLNDVIFITDERQQSTGQLIPVAL